MPYEEWKKIGEEWDKAIPGPGSVKDYGFTMKIIDPSYDIRLYVIKKQEFFDKFLAEYMLPDEEMSLWVANWMLVNEKFAEEMEKQKKEDREWRCVTIYTETQQYYKKHSNEVKKYAEDHLPSLNTIEFFRQLPD